MRRSAVRWVARALAAAAGLLGLIAFAHTPLGRPLLGALGILRGCPVSLDHADPARVEDFRRTQLRAHAGSQTAGALTAGDFLLGSSREQVRSWLSAHAARCEDKRAGSVISCVRVGQGKGELRALHLQFDGRARLVAVDFFRPARCAGEVLQQLQSTTARLEREVGPLTARRGETSAFFLEGGGYRRAATEFKYADYFAEVSAMSDRGGGVRLRESYQWLPSDPS